MRDDGIARALALGVEVVLVSSLSQMRMPQEEGRCYVKESCYCRKAIENDSTGLTSSGD